MQGINPPLGLLDHSPADFPTKKPWEIVEWGMQRVEEHPESARDILVATRELLDDHYDRLLHTNNDLTIPIVEFKKVATLRSIASGGLANALVGFSLDELLADPTVISIALDRVLRAERDSLFIPHFDEDHPLCSDMPRGYRHPIVRQYPVMSREWMFIAECMHLFTRTRIRHLDNNPLYQSLFDLIVELQADYIEHAQKCKQMEGRAESPEKVRPPKRVSIAEILQGDIDFTSGVLLDATESLMRILRAVPRFLARIHLEHDLDKANPWINDYANIQRGFLRSRKQITARLVEMRRHRFHKLMGKHEMEGKVLPFSSNLLDIESVGSSDWSIVLRENKPPTESGVGICPARPALVHHGVKASRGQFAMQRILHDNDIPYETAASIEELHGFIATLYAPILWHQDEALDIVMDKQPDNLITLDLGSGPRL